MKPFSIPIFNAMPRINPNPQGRYWMLVIPLEKYMPPATAEALPDAVQWLKGQVEKGAGGYLHWQMVCSTKKPSRMLALKAEFGYYAHLELTRSVAADAYVFKDETAVADTRFELGAKKLNRKNAADWDLIRQQAERGQFADIPSDVYIRSYSSLRRINIDALRPTHRGAQEVNVYWGVSGAGKTRRVFEEAGEVFYIKSSTTKWFDSYRGEANVIMDEFTGTMDIVHLLKWLDCYPLTVEVKGGQVVLASQKWWITSNVDPADWYREKATPEQQVALRRRMTNVVHYTEPWGGIMG